MSPTIRILSGPQQVGEFAPRPVQADAHGIRCDTQDHGDLSRAETLPNGQPEKLPLLVIKPCKCRHQINVPRVIIHRRGFPCHSIPEERAPLGRPPLVRKAPPRSPKTPRHDRLGWNVIEPAPDDHERVGYDIVGFAAATPPHVTLNRDIRSVEHFFEACATIGTDRERISHGG